MTLSDDLADFTIFAGEPSSLPSGPECTESSNTQPPPHILNHDVDKICIANLSHEPQVLSCNVHFSRVQSVFTLDNQDSQPPQDDMTQPLTSQSKRKDHQLFSVWSCGPRSHTLPLHTWTQFHTLLQECDDVFDAAFPGYNGKARPFKANVNMGPVPPLQRKGHLPQYARDKPVELQQKFDDLERLWVFI